MKRIVVIMALAVAFLVGMGVGPAYATEWVGGQYDEIVWHTPGQGDGLTDVAHVSTYISEDGDTLKVVFHAWLNYYVHDFMFAETHVAVASCVDGIPHTRGGPVPGRFAYGTEHSPWVRDYTYYVDVSELEPPFVVCAHAVVVRLSDGVQETGWATGCHSGSWAFPGRNWARYFMYPRPS